MDGIKRLSEDTINKIAAGEVIDRPASVLKELVENSLDAGSTAVSVRVEDAGLACLEVSDNGLGMKPEDLRHSLLRHTTSKIRDVSDLAVISSFGFRGEALASIGAVAKIEMVSVPHGQKEGLSVKVEGGKIVDERPAWVKQGTTVSVRELFYNTPARKKFLKGRNVEIRNLRAAFWDLAVPCEGVEFTFQVEGTDEITVPAGLEVPDRVRMKESDLGMHLRTFHEVSPYFLIKGMISTADRTFARSNRISIFVNRRAVRDGTGVAAVKEGMRGLIPEQRYPCAYLFIEVSPDEADFNVHPAKKEVRFRYGRELFDLISHSVKKVFLAGMGSVPPGYESSPESECRVPQEGRGESKYRMEGFPGRSRGWQESHPLPGETIPDREGKGLFERRVRFSDKKLLGQFFGNYALLDGGDELVFLDIHAASERVSYWKIQEGFKQWLEKPEHLLINTEIAVARLDGLEEELRTVLTDAGYTVEIDGDTLKISAVPHYLKGIDPVAVVEESLDLLRAESENPLKESKKRLEDLMAKMACHASLRGSRFLPEEAVKHLLRELDGAVYNQTCPHGRPVYIRVTRKELHKRFGRM